MSEPTRLGPGAEFDKIRKMIAAMGQSAGSIGDDAAILSCPAGSQLVVSTDISVEDIHFRRDWLSFEEIGYRATAAALSDIAAMGANPIGVLLAIACPDEQAASLVEIARGAAAAAGDSGSAIIGGDLSGAAVLSITATVLGHSPRPLTRSGARAGDNLYVTGTLGGSALGLNALRRGANPMTGAREKFARPKPRISEALWLSEKGASSCIDISDGIVGDLGHIAAASGVNLLVDVDRIPLFSGASTDIALSSGEEYELCVTSVSDIDVDGFESKFGIPLSIIGVVEASKSPQVIFQKSGAQVEVPRSYTHFSE